MANPTQAQIDKLTTNATRWDNIINGAASATVALDSFTVKTVAGYLQDLQATNPRGTWGSGTVYALKDVVVESSTVYICTIAHTSTSSFSDDYTAGKWAIYQLDVTSAITFGDDFTVDTNTLHVDSSNNRVGIGTTSGAFTNSLGIGKLSIESDLYTLTNTVAYNDSTGNYPAFAVSKAKGSAASPSPVDDGHRLGRYFGMGYDGSNFRNAGYITFEVDGSVSTGVMPGKITFATSAAGSSSPTNRMCIDSAGKVGIGTDDPGQQFEIVASNSRKFQFDTGKAFLVGSNSSWASKYAFKSTNGTDLGGFYAYGTETALNYFNIGAAYNDGMISLITSTGSVGMGTVTPSSKAVLTLTSTTKGFLPPRMTETQRDAISTPPAGLIIYNTTDNKLNLYTTSWEEISSFT